MRNKSIVINHETLVELVTFKMNELNIKPDGYEQIPNDEFRETLIPSERICPRCQAIKLREISIVLGRRIRDFNTLTPEEMFTHLSMNSMPQFDRKSIKVIPIVFNCSNCLYYQPLQGWDKFLKQEEKLRKELNNE